MLGAGAAAVPGDDRGVHRGFSGPRVLPPVPLLQHLHREVVKLERGTESIRGRFGRLPVHGAIPGRCSRLLFPERTDRRPQIRAGRNRLAGTVRTPSSTKSRVPVLVTW